MMENNIDNKHLKENPFSVPDGYFDQLERSVMKKVSNPKPKVFGRSGIRYALITSAAAALVFVFGTISMLKFGNESAEQAHNEIYKEYNSDAVTGSEPQKEMSELTPDEIIEYLKHNEIDVSAIGLID